MILYMLNGKIIVIDDNEAVLKTLKMILSRTYKTVVGVSVPTLLPVLLREGDTDVVLLDMNFGTGKQDGREGLFWLDRILECRHAPEVILITAFGDIDLAVSSLKKGASDFLVKPWDNEKLEETVRAAWERRNGKQAADPDEETVSEGEGHEPVARFLIGSLLKKYARLYAKPLLQLTPEAVNKLSGLVLAGDLAALQQTLERAILLTDATTLGASDLYIDQTQTASLSRPVTLEEMEKQFIVETLNEKKGNLTLCAQQLGISRQTLYNKMRKYGLQ